jgi:uncharacterized protein involved in high-affinity Fe2+ transport
LYAFFISPMRATDTAHLILDLITRIISGEAYKLWYHVSPPRQLGVRWAANNSSQ